MKLDPEKQNMEILQIELEMQNEELITKSHELELKTEQLTTYNEDLISKTHELEIKNNALTASEEFLQQIIDLLPVGVFWKDVNGVYLGGNAHQLKTIGFPSLAFLIGKKDEDMPWQKEAEKYKADDKLVLQGQSLFNIEETMTIPNAQHLFSKRYIETNKVPIRDKNKKIIGVLGCWRETTEIKKLIQQLQSSNDQLSQFALIASHDLKAPLRAMDSLINWIIEDVGKGKDVTQFKELLNKSSKKMTRFIDGILEYSRIGYANTEIEQVDVNLVINSVIDALGIRENANIKMTKTISSTLMVQFNKTSLYQIFSNLISNAIKHHHDPQNIKIDINYAKEYKDGEFFHEFYVADNGPGIDPKFHEKIFQMFYMSNPNTDGTGIGLPITKRILKSAHGDINVKSGISKGSCFIFSIPVIPFTTTYPMSGTENTVRILIIDDNPSITKILAETLKKAYPQYEILEANDSFLAGTLVADQKPNVVILDLLMPGMDGFDVCSKIKSRIETHYIEVIAITAFPSPEHEKKILECGARVCLAKPLDMNNLIQEVAASIKKD